MVAKGGGAAQKPGRGDEAETLIRQACRHRRRDRRGATQYAKTATGRPTQRKRGSMTIITNKAKRQANTAGIT